MRHAFLPNGHEARASIQRRETAIGKKAGVSVQRERGG
jgi:hypothetical protein